MQGIDRRRWLALALSSPVVLAGCGGGTDTTKAHVRFVNASGYDALTLEVDGDDLFQSVAWGDETLYRDVDPGDADSRIFLPGAASALVPTFTPSLSEDDWYTVLAWGPVGDAEWALLDENESDADDDESRLRVFNGATDAGTLDVYVTAENEPLANASATLPGETVGQAGDFVNIRRGTWRVRVTAAGSKTDVRLDVPGVVFDGERVYTLVLSAATSGMLVDGLLLRQETRAQARLAVTQTRVRVAAGVTDGATVTAVVAGQGVLSSGAPAVSEYVLLQAQTPAVAVAIGGTDVSATVEARGLAAGNDYTLLVYGSAAVPRATWLVDDNSLPTNATKARLRLVNAVGDLGSTLSLKLGASQLASEVGVGTASAYAEVTPTASGTLSVTFPGGSGALLTLSEQIIEAGKVYTVLVGGSAARPDGELIEDR